MRTAAVLAMASVLGCGAEFGDAGVPDAGGGTAAAGDDDAPRDDDSAASDDDGTPDPDDGDDDTAPSDDTAPEDSGCFHPPTNDPTADDTGLAPGPIDRFTVKVYYIKRPPDDTIVDPVESGGVWWALVGDKIVFDSTQKNAANEVCQWESEPEYTVWDSGCDFQRLNTSNPFLLQMEALAPGRLEVSATIDGVDSNTVVLQAE